MDKLKKKFKRNEQTVFSMANCVCLCDRGGCPCNQVDYDYWVEYNTATRMNSETHVVDFNANWT